MTQPTTTTNPYPDVAPPVGTKPDIWETDQCVVMGADRTIDGHDGLAWTSAVQYSDGSLRQVFVHVDMPTNDHMTSDQARVFAAQLIAAADEIDRWITT
jgi:hypothetical protein